jgi:dinuclear metal center YbgI/SA1388 family protein
MKKVTLKELTSHLNQLLETKSFSDSCINGLQVQGKEDIKKIAFAVTANHLVIEKAAQENVDALIVHHGLFWNSESHLLDKNKVRRLKPLLEKDISLLAYHLPLDAHQTMGNNWKAASDLGWSSLEPFGDYKGIKLGVKGKIEPTSIEIFIAELEAHFQHGATTALFGQKIVKTAAFISGGAYAHLSQAAIENIDVFITGNFDEPAWWIAQEEKVHFIALGHAATEKTGIVALKEYVERKLGLEALFIDLPNPF